MQLTSQLIVYGVASAKTVANCPVDATQMDMNLMDFLRQNNVPVASSCFGEGICRKCAVLEQTQTIVLSCQITVGEYLKNYGENLAISYL